MFIYKNIFYIKNVSISNFHQTNINLSKSNKNHFSSVFPICVSCVFADVKGWYNKTTLKALLNALI